MLNTFAVAAGKDLTRALSAYSAVHLSVNYMLLVRRVLQPYSYLPPSVLTSHHSASSFQTCIYSVYSM